MAESTLGHSSSHLNFLFYLFIYFLIFKINLFIYLLYFWLHGVFVAAHGLSLVVASGGFPCCGAWALGARASVVVARGLSSCGSRALELRLSCCGAQA